MAYSNVNKVAVRLGRSVSSLSSDEIAQIAAWIEDAEVLLRSLVAGIDESIAQGDLDRATVATVVTQAVVRHAINPEGKKDARIDDFSYGLHPDAARPEIHFTDQELATLRPDGASTEGAFTAVSPLQSRAAGTWTAPDTWVSA